MWHLLNGISSTLTEMT